MCNLSLTVKRRKLIKEYLISYIIAYRFFVSKTYTIKSCTYKVLDIYNYKRNETKQNVSSVGTYFYGELF